MRGPLHNEVRQSLSLIALTAMTMLVYIGIGMLAVHVLG
jgi:hypothetical protein